MFESLYVGAFTDYLYSTYTFKKLDQAVNPLYPVACLFLPGEPSKSGKFHGRVSESACDPKNLNNMRSNSVKVSDLQLQKIIDCK